MSVPDLAKPAYQRLVSAPLSDTKALKREIVAARPALLDGANVHRPVAEQAIGVAAALIDAVEATGIDFPNMAQQLREIGNALADNVGAGGGVKIDRLLCPNDVTYFYPYYLSGVDALFWRSGAPVTDMTHLSTMINPFSSDRIGPDGATWAHVYPRHGFVNNDHPGHVAPVAAYRSADLVADGGVRLRPKRTTVYARGDWQTLAPQPTAFCAAAIGDLPTPIDPEGGYAHNIWPRFECPLSEIGIFVAFIPYRYCFTW